MKSPTSEATRTALFVLMQSISVQNEANFLCPPPLQPISTYPMSSEQVEESITAIRVACAAMLNEAALHIAALHRCRNAAVPNIHRLPVELLCKIFSYSIDEERRSFARLKELASVSTWWWRVIERSPALWTRITIGDPIPLMLRNSGTAPLTLNVSRGTPTKSQVRDFFAQVATHFGRWESLNLDIPYLDDLAPYLATSAPQLKTLDLQYTGFETSPFVEFVGGPQLRHLTLHSISTRWDSPAFCGLKTLSLSCVWDNLPFTHELDQILLSCPELEMLAFVDIMAKNCMVWQGQLQSIVLPKLRAVEIADCSLDLLHHLSSSIRTEKLVKLVIKGTGSSNQLQDLVGDGRTSLLAAAVRNLVCIKVSIAAETLYIRTDPAEGDMFNISLRGSSWTEAFAKVATLFSVTLLNTPLNLFISPLSSLNADYSFIGSFGTLRRLELHPNVPPQPIIEFLSTPRTSMVGHLVWPCPELEELHLPRNVDKGSMLSALSNRQEYASWAPRTLVPLVVL